jgi:hypothetical protein
MDLINKAPFSKSKNYLPFCFLGDYTVLGSQVGVTLKQQWQPIMICKFPLTSQLGCVCLQHGL